MKKFKIIRNILIIIAITIATVYVLWIRSNKTNTSKTANLYKKMYQRSENITMKISYKDERIDVTIIKATNKDEREEVSGTICNYADEIKKEPDSEGAIIGTITSKDKVVGYKYFPKLNKYQILYTGDEGNESINTWISEFTEKISNCRYYTRGYESINGKMLYCETFKEAKLKFYFDKDKLVYIKSEEIDQSFNDVTDALYSVEISNDDSYKEILKVPENEIPEEKLMKTNEDEENI